MNYRRFRKMIGGNWTMSRCSKIAVIIIVGVIVWCFIVLGQTREEQIDQIEELQKSMSDIVRLELEYTSKNIIADEDRWLPIDAEGHIYSAYLETRPDVILKYSSAPKLTWGQIVIIALLPSNIPKNRLTCLLKFENADREKIVKKIAAHIRVLNEHWDLKFSAFFVICDLTWPKFREYDFLYDVKQLPESAGIEARGWKGGGGQFVDIHYPKFGVSGDDRKAGDMAVCVPVLHHNFNRALELIEFIEYYEMMGITHFTFYNSSISPEVSKVLKYYGTKLVASVLDWDLPPIYVYEQTLRHAGLFAALNDCLYRTTNHHGYTYMGTFDVDEFLVPKSHANFSELIHQLDASVSHTRDTTAALIFRNVYFYTMYADDDAVSGLEPYLYTRAKTKRLRKPHNPRDRSRYIVRGRDALEIGNYNVWEFLKKELKDVSVDPEVALLHHYAPCEAEETGCYLKDIQIDKTAQRFSPRLGERVGKACSEIFGDAGCPLPKKRAFGSE